MAKDKKDGKGKRDLELAEIDFDYVGAARVVKNRAGRKRDEREITLSRVVVAQKYLEGLPVSAIAEELGVTPGQIYYDLRQIKQEWLESSLVDYNEVKARELARIDNLERTYWEAWRDSQEPETTTKKYTSGTKEATEVSVKQRVGANVFLDGVRWCIEQRCKIFGLYAASSAGLVDWRWEAEKQGVNANEIFEKLVSGYLAALSAGEGSPDGGGEAGSPGEIEADWQPL